MKEEVRGEEKCMNRKQFFLINNRNLTSFGNYKIVACCIKLPVMRTLVKTVMTAVDLFQYRATFMNRVLQSNVFMTNAPTTFLINTHIIQSKTAKALCGECSQLQNHVAYIYKFDFVDAKKNLFCSCDFQQKGCAVKRHL